MNTGAGKKLSGRLNELTATEVARLVSAGEVTCEAVVRACLERIAQREPEVGAWHYLNPERVIARARDIDKGSRRGPLIGVPFGIKDIIDSCDMPTEYGSPIYRGHQPKNDATCIALGRKAGGLLLGKTVTTEFANQYPGKTRNPFDPTRTPGGSSSGSAAAVGDCMVPLAIGTQTTGSTIRPASFCGTFGYRPTYGDLRCTGVKEASGSLDTLGLIARSVEDIALYRDVLLGIEPQPLPAAPRIPTIGFCRTHLWPVIEPYTQKLLEDAAQALRNAGAVVKEITPPPELERIEDAHRWISSFEFARNFTWEIENHWEGISERLRGGRIKDGLSCTYEKYVESRNFAEKCRMDFGQIFGDCDVLLAASATGEAPVGTNSTGNVSPSAIWTTVHVPVMTIPVFKGPHGLPVGAQLVARRNDDRKLFSSAQWIYRQLT
jgi:Asp-tRNA(Asn)/Glu-tRNA(Gln) amidotransferase A subunit family amidase